MNKKDLIVPPSQVEEILIRAKEKWDYDHHKYWFPLRPTGQLINHKGKCVVFDNDEPAPAFDWFFIREKFMKKQYESVLDLLFKGKSEAVYFIPLVDDDLFFFERHEFERFENDFAEYACFPHGFSWIYYKSHEGTVSFAGTILNKVKRILASELKNWNEF